MDGSFLILFNPSHEDASVTLPGEAYGSSWSVVLDTGGGSLDAERAAGSQQEIGARSLARSLAVLRHA